MPTKKFFLSQPYGTVCRSCNYRIVKLTDSGCEGPQPSWGARTERPDIEVVENKNEFSFRPREFHSGRISAECRKLLHLFVAIKARISTALRRTALNVSLSRDRRPSRLADFRKPRLGHMGFAAVGQQCVKRIGIVGAAQ